MFIFIPLCYIIRKKEVFKMKKTTLIFIFFSIFITNANAFKFDLWKSGITISETILT